MSKKEKAVVYARVSTDKEEQEKSLESQKEYYAEYAVEQGFDFLKVYYDEGLSATSSNRKYFIRMLEDAGLDAVRIDTNIIVFKTSNRDSSFDWIIIKDASRFARNVNAIDIAKALRDKNVYIEFESLGFDTKNSVDWEFRLSLFLTFSQEESLNTSRKLKDAYQKRAKKGEFHMSVHLLGYARDEETKEYYIKEDEAEIVKQIFDLYTVGEIGSYRIADQLNEQGYKTKRGKAFNGNSITRVLRNEKYKGQVIQNRYGKTDITGSNKRVINPKSEWIIHNDALPKIVSIEQFDNAQELLKSRTGTARKSLDSEERQVRGRKIIENVFYGKIKCGNCQSDYVRHSVSKVKGGQKVIEHIYICKNRRNVQRTAGTCKNRGISHNVLERELIKIGSKMAADRFNEWYIEGERKALMEKHNEIDRLIDTSDGEIGNIDMEIQSVDNQINNLFNTLSSGVSESIVKMTHDKIKQFENEKKKLNLKKVDFNTIELQNKKKRYSDKYEEIVKLSRKTSYTFEELLPQIKEILILKTNKVFVKFRTPTLVKQLPTTNSFLHEDSGEPTIIYWFDR